MTQEGTSDLHPLDPPQEHLQASVDEKHRLNTPARAAAYFRSHGIEDFFCTTLDGRMILVYPRRQWLRQLEAMATSPETAAVAKRLGFRGKANGGEVSFDKNNRLLLPANLRAKVTLDGTLWLDFQNGYMRAMSKAVYDQEYGITDAHQAEDLRVWEAAGMI